MPFTQIAYRLRGFLVSLPLIVALFCFSLETEMDYFIWPIGISLVFTGMILRIWAQQHLRYRLKVKKCLTTTGPYSLARNPIYVGNILMCLGAIITSELLWLVPIALLYWFSTYSLVVHYEERHLLEKYGEPYRRYLAEVPRWLPRAIRFRNFEILNKYFLNSIVAEIQCPCILLPYIFKELVSPWFGH
jgi:protein-S-isoprenylcysteine O-methyltransferase Ste14